MEIMADADAVLLAGGDGTIMEAVTGLMKRSDRAEAAKVPIGILPVGKTNSLAHSLFGVDDDVKLMGEAKVTWSTQHTSFGRQPIALAPEDTEGIPSRPKHL